MEQDSAMPQGFGYGGGDSWLYNHGPFDDSPMNECAGFTRLDDMLPPSQAQQQIHHHHLQLIQPAPADMCHHQLPLLNTTWPSQLTNPTPTSSAGSYSAAALAMTPGRGKGPSQAPDVVKQPGQPDKTPRKTLSAEQKRAMCQYHDENPGTRQADIGAKFGVERSTVSKVLRHRDQYLKRDQDTDFAFKRAKGKHPDFDRTLSNYIRRQQQRGFDIKDDEILEQAKLFARASGNQEGLVSSLTGGWLVKFKHKHGIGSGRLMRRASETNIPDSAISPLSWSRSDEDLHSETLEFELTYRRDTSTTSDEPPLSSADVVSPSASYSFSPDSFPLEAPGWHHQRAKRSKTFPSIDVSFVQRETTADEPTTPRHHPPVPSPSSSIQSPTSDFRPAAFAMDTSSLHRTSSSSSLTGRSSGTPVTGSTHAGAALDSSSPDSPTLDEARQAANTLLSYLQRMSPSGHFDQGDFLAVAQLTNKLQLQQHQTSRPCIIGGLSRIPEGDHEMPLSFSAATEVR